MGRNGCWFGYGAFGLCSLMLVAVAAGQGTVTTKLSRREIYEGETVHYEVSAVNADEPQEPDLSQLTDFDVQKLDESAQNQEYIRIINGQRSVTRRTIKRYLYALTPRKGGTLTIPAPVINQANGTPLTGNQLTLQVIGVEAQDLVILSTFVEPSSVYLEQPFEVRVEVLVHPLPGRNRDENPLAIYRRDPFRRSSNVDAPQLQIPWMDDENIPSGITSEEPIADVLSNWYADSGAGFQINEIGRDRLNAMLGLSRLLDSTSTFQPRPDRVERQDDTGQKVRYWRYVFRRSLRARDVGKVSFGPATLKGVFAKADDDANPVGQNVYAIAQPVTVTIKDAPLAGRPAGFIGAVGAFTFSADVTPREAHVGDPLDLLIQVSGQGTFDRIRPPDLSAFPAVAKRFRIHEPVVESTENGREYRYRIRPLSAQVHEFPSLELAYFDVNGEQFVTVNTAAIPLSISEAERLSAADIIGASGSSSGEPKADDAVESPREIGDNVVSFSHFGAGRVRIKRWIAGWTCLFAAYLAVTVVIQRNAHLRRNPALARRQRAWRRAQTARRAAEQLAEDQQFGRAATEIRSAIVGYLADMNNVHEQSMTSREAREFALQLGCDPSTVAEIQTLVEDIDALRYSPTVAVESELFQRGVSVLQQLESFSRPAMLARKIVND
ncbi:MAG: BatD family protein [Planctomycetales bacterium]|nr:BatD family protein [Planctomycetales bacterium]